jgi:hypothetical protein
VRVGPIGGFLLIMLRRVFAVRIPCLSGRWVLYKCACCGLHAEVASQCCIGWFTLQFLQQALQHQSERLAEYRAQLGEEVRLRQYSQPAVLRAPPSG